MNMIRIILLSLVTASASAEIYRWKDANGNWQFGDRAPQAEHETLDIKPPPKIGQDDALDIHARTQRLLQSQQTQARHKALAEKNARDEYRERFAQPCKEAEKRLAQMRGPFVYVNEDGTHRNANAEEVVADQKKTQKWIDEHCDF